MSTKSIVSLRNLLVILVTCLVIGSPVYSQNIDQSYRTPPLDIADIVDAQPTPLVSVDPSKQWMLLMGRPGLPTISELSQPELRIAGMRINPANDGISRSTFYNSLILQNLDTGGSRSVSGLPDNPRIRNVSWAPDGQRIAFTLDLGDRLELWIADTGQAVARRVVDAGLNGIFGAPFSWLSDGERLLVKTIPSDRGATPLEPLVPLGPIIQESTGRPAAARTYQDLLQDGYDEDLFEYHGQVQLAIVSVSGSKSELGEPALVRRATMSPDDNYVLIEEIHRPFSYLVPQYRFPNRIQIWDAQGNLVREIADLPLAEEVPIGRGAVPMGPRSVSWRADAPATAYWVEAQDGGDPRMSADIRDTVFVSRAPFEAEPSELISLGLRYAGITWGNGDVALVNESWWSTRQIRTWIVAPDRDSSSELLFDRSTEDRYNDPGTPITARNAFGKRSLVFDESGRSIYFRGNGASPEGDRPFLDRLNLTDQSSERLWRSEAPTYASFISFLDNEHESLLVRRESPTEPGNYYHVDLGASNQLTALTNFAHPYPHMLDVYKEVVRYERDDGVMLTATLYLPPGQTKEDGPFPMLMWAYPREFKDADSAGQMRGSPYRFNGISVNGPLPFPRQWLCHFRWPHHAHYRRGRD